MDLEIGSLFSFFGFRVTFWLKERLICNCEGENFGEFYKACIYSGFGEKD